MLVYGDVVQAFEGASFAWVASHASRFEVIFLRDAGCDANFREEHFAFVISQVGAGADAIKPSEDIV